MKITNEWLKEQSACVDGYKWSQGQDERELKPFCHALISADHFDWANWVVTHAMTHGQRIQYAVFAAEQVIKIYEDVYPDDTRPRNAIEAAKRCIGVKEAAEAAARAAEAAAEAAEAAAGADAKDKMRLTIINYGMSLLEDNHE
jgi:uncharacterized protein (UPF0147 family)